jgi:hypothetical protein
MAQMTWRAGDELMERVRRQAAASGRSMNEYVTAVLDAATDPDLSGDLAERVRDRLALAGLLLAPTARAGRQPARRAVAEARARAGRGVPLSRLVSEQR